VGYVLLKLNNGVFMGDGIERLKKMVIPLFGLVFLTSLYFSITDNGEITFIEGVKEMTTDPIFYYIIIGLVGVGVIIYFVGKITTKNKEGEE
jgi:uncharacterized membrane protein YuzA (DUF378 family)